MGAEYEFVWPKCQKSLGCTERCQKPKCRTAGGRETHHMSLESLGFSHAGRKNSPERMAYLLNKLTEWPNVTKACAFAGISYTTIKYWLKKSATGRPGDGFDLEYAEETKRFHEHYSDALECGVQQVEDAYLERALSGYYETLHHQGRVAYQYDQGLLDLGLSGPDAYLLDENGRPIPERIHHQDPEVMLSVLKAWRRDKYGQKDQLDITHRGGVMVVTAPARTSKELEALAQEMLAAPVDVDFVDADFTEVPAEPSVDGSE